MAEKKNPCTECPCNIKERERIHVLAYSQKCESWWFWFRGSVNPYKVSIPPEFAPLSFTLGYGVKKIILKTIPIKLPRRSFLQVEIIKNHEVLAAFLPEIICFLIFPWLFSFTEKFTNFGKPHLSSSFVADHEDMKVSTCFCFHYESFPTIYMWLSKSDSSGWIHALESSGI